MKNTILALSILASFSALASDDEIKSKKNDSYFSVSIGKQESTMIKKFNDNINNDYSHDLISTVDDSVPLLKFTFGYNFDENFGIETQVQYARYKGSIYNSRGRYVNVEAEFLNYGGYFVGKIPVEKFNFFAKAGLVGTYTSTESPYSSKNESSAGLGYGFGLDYAVNDDWKIIAEYGVINSEFKSEDNEQKSISIGVAKYF